MDDVPDPDGRNVQSRTSTRPRRDQRSARFANPKRLFQRLPPNITDITDDFMTGHRHYYSRSIDGTQILERIEDSAGRVVFCRCRKCARTPTPTGPRPTMRTTSTLMHMPTQKKLPRDRRPEPSKVAAAAPPKPSPLDDGRTGRVEVKFIDVLNAVQAKSTVPMSDHEPLDVSYSPLGSRDAFLADNATVDSYQDEADDAVDDSRDRQLLSSHNQDSSSTTTQIFCPPTIVPVDSVKHAADTDRGFNEIFCPPVVAVGSNEDSSSESSSSRTLHDTADTDRGFNEIFCPPVVAVGSNEDSSSESSSSRTLHDTADTDRGFDEIFCPPVVAVVDSTEDASDDEFHANSEFPLSFGRPAIADDDLLLNPWLTKDDDDFKFENRLKDFSRAMKVSTGPDDAKYSAVSLNLTITAPPKYPPGLPLNVRYPKSQALPKDPKTTSTLHALLDPSVVDNGMDIFDITNFDSSPRQLEDSDCNFNATFRLLPGPQIAPSDVGEDPPPAYSEVEEAVVPPNLKPLVDAKCPVPDRLLPHPRSRFRSLLSPFPPLFQSILFRLPTIMTGSIDLQASTDLSSDLDDVDDETLRNVSVPAIRSCTSTPLLSRNDAKYLRQMLPLAEIFLHDVNMNQVIVPKLSTPAPRLVVFKPP
ncbi:hypothetical protein LshimejAT787_1200940 [Lyophyllum shimeji]|uniref:Uncharacterized protein n=1 Tax=Lyophyllum shimeji TaxID=47721 RepID=A0A9P3PTN1_LYOSH|nr:hypothetical protein LshimejAT787_1200940 [Lyophyllum shimeji]